MFDAQHVHEFVQGPSPLLVTTELLLELLGTSLLHCKLNFCFPMNVLSIWTLVP